jgi:hypothetical protein
MLDGKTAEGLAMANTAILMRLIEELIDRGIIATTGAGALLRDAADKLENCPTSSQSNVADAVAIIRKDLLPRILKLVRAG